MLIRSFNQAFNRRVSLVKISSKRRFTLLEVMICLCLLASISTLFVFKIHTALQKSRFDHAVHEVELKLNFCKKLALLRQQDVFLQLYQSEEGLVCDIGSEEGKGLEKGKPPIRSCYPSLSLSQSEIPSQKLSFTFSSTGQVVPKRGFALENLKARFTKDIKL